MTDKRSSNFHYTFETFSQNILDIFSKKIYHYSFSIKACKTTLIDLFAMFANNREVEFQSV